MSRPSTVFWIASRKVAAREKDSRYVVRLALCLLTGCLDFCGFSHGDANAKYLFSYTNPDGTTASGEFTTNQYGQDSFDAGTDTDCSQVTVTKDESSDEAMLEESAV